MGQPQPQLGDINAVAELLGIGVEGARSWLRRRGVAPAGTGIGAAGLPVLTWDLAQVAAARAEHRPRGMAALPPDQRREVAARRRASEADDGR